MYSDRIAKISQEIKEELIALRRDIHKHPEIGFKENRTSSLIADILEGLNIEVQRNKAVTGVVGLLKGKYPGKTVLLRADMDCLPIQELNELEYKSEYPGLMHACGHDAHISWLIGTAMILSKLREELHGNVKFVFQPCEERSGGAELLIKEGVMENPKVDIALGAHIWPDIPSGNIGVKYGAMMGAPDAFKIIIKGKGGHGATPQNCIDPISIGCQIYNSIQNDLTRRIDPLEPVLVSICKFNAGSNYNIIPDSAELEGTIRTLSHAARKKVPSILESTIKGLCEANGASYEFKYEAFCPPVINDVDLTAFVEKNAKDYLGNDKVTLIERPTMIGEDFSCYQEKAPGVFLHIGNYNENKNTTYGLHHPNFNVDEDVIPNTSRLFAYLTLKYLE